METIHVLKIKRTSTTSANWWRLCLFILLGAIQYITAQEKQVIALDSINPQSITQKEFNIQEVEVKGRLKDANLKSGSTGLEIDVKQLKLLPKFMGENDFYKALQYMGGVSQAGEASSDLNVRGGNNDQNLVLLNGAFIQNPTHVLGLFSVFNPDLIGQMRFIKSGMPAEYGGRLSSIVDINTVNAIPEKIEVKGSIGLISSRMAVQLPINSKFSVYSSLRGSYISSIILPTLTLFGVDKELTQNKYEFWDLNTGFIFNLSSRTKLTGDFYTGQDVLKIKNLKNSNLNENSSSWGNTAATLKMNHLFNDVWSMSHQLNYSKFQIQSLIDWQKSGINLRSQFENLNYKADFFHLAGNHQIKFGIEISYNSAVPQILSADSILPFENKNERNIINSAQLTGYLRDEWIYKNWLFNVGIRANLYAQIGPYTDFKADGNESYQVNSIVKTFPISIEPRLFTRYLINPQSSLKLSATRHYQYFNQVPVFSFGFPSDLQIPSSLYVQPQSSWHFSGGYFHNLLDNNWEMSVEVYYKTLENQLEYKNGVESTFSNTMFEKDLLVGKGWTYGSEWKLSKNAGKFTGWISYNLAWSYRQFDQLNGGKPFLARNDRRHDVSLVGMYKLNEKWNFSALFVYASGSRLNFPVSWFMIDNKIILEYGKYNGFEMPAYHRLDISANCKLKPWHGIQSELNFSVYNIYNRANPFQVYLS
ncbi:MAG: TonB-dependent receptor plug domain-containing protein, partial [Paludibacter sp.]